MDYKSRWMIKCICTTCFGMNAGDGMAAQDGCISIRLCVTVSSAELVFWTLCKHLLLSRGIYGKSEMYDE